MESRLWSETYNFARFFARVLNDGLACLSEDGHHLVVDAVTFYTAAAVVEQHHWAVALQFVLEEVLGQAKRPQVERKDSSPKYSLVGL